ncbi:MAG TPA: response regulator transcription factor [Thermoanaerobaculia bacterium]|nr:response regulator transcription factor [Thermoanaerobaculia bacterium]
MKILVVDDDADLSALIAFALKKAGYLVVEAADGQEALARFEEEEPTLVILDVNLPRKSGFEVLAALRRRSKVPVIFLTVRGAEEDVVAGLDAGADDYVTKPFSPRSLLARVRAQLRRTGFEKANQAARGDLVLDFDQQTVKVAGAAPVPLTTLEAKLLQVLLAHAGTTLPTERLLSAVWGSRGGGDRQLLKQLVHRLRRKIEPDPAVPRYLQTASGVGYRLAADGRPGEED